MDFKIGSDRILILNFSNFPINLSFRRHGFAFDPLAKKRKTERNYDTETFKAKLGIKK